MNSRSKIEVFHGCVYLNCKAISARIMCFALCTEALFTDAYELHLSWIICLLTWFTASTARVRN